MAAKNKCYCVLLRSTFHNFPHSLGRIELSCVCAFHLFRFPRSNGWEMIIYYYYYHFFFLCLDRSGVCDVRMDKIQTTSHLQMRNDLFSNFQFSIIIILFSIDDDVLVDSCGNKNILSFTFPPVWRSVCVLMQDMYTGSAYHSSLTARNVSLRI